MLSFSNSREGGSSCEAFLDAFGNIQKTQGEMADGQPLGYGYTGVTL